jgi:hypothetical protein
MTQLEALRIAHKIQRRLLSIEQALETREVREQQGANEMIDPKVAALIVKFDEATNAIAAIIQKLIDAGGLSADSEAALQAEVAKLQVLGADPANPVPVVAE